MSRLLQYPRLDETKIPSLNSGKRTRGVDAPPVRQGTAAPGAVQPAPLPARGGGTGRAI